MRDSTLCLAVALGLSTACRAATPGASTSDPRNADGLKREVAGCYALFGRGGRPASGTLYWAPATARLDPDGRAIRLTPSLDAGRPSGPGAYRWSTDSTTDSLRVLFHNGFSGTEFMFAWTGAGADDTIRGRAREFWDAGPRRTEAGAASAIRIACAATGLTGPSAPDA